MPTAAQRRIRKFSWSPYTNRPQLKGQRAIETMAHDMQCFTANTGCVTTDDLEVMGWSAAQIESFGKQARAYGYSDAAG